MGASAASFRVGVSQKLRTPLKMYDFSGESNGFEGALMTLCQHKNKAGSSKPVVLDGRSTSPKVPRRLTIFFLISTATKMPGGEALESANVLKYDNGICDIQG